MISIIDYGMANLRSVYNAFRAVGEPAVIVSTPSEVARADRLVLPGVGAFRDAIATLRAAGLDEAVAAHIGTGRPFLGICLGLQMLMDVSHEGGNWSGLGIIHGTCERFDVDATLGLKVPHMGWNQLAAAKPSPVTAGLASGANVYFVHGYHVRPADASVVATYTDYGRPFVSAVAQNNVIATQFHPEKSQGVGMQILRNFAGM